MSRVSAAGGTSIFVTKGDGRRIPIMTGDDSDGIKSLIITRMLREPFAGMSLEERVAQVRQEAIDSFKKMSGKP